MNTGGEAGAGPVVVRVEAELEPLIPRFLEKRRGEIEILRRAGAAGDLETLRALGHALKGTAGGYGFDHLSELGARLETLTIEGDVPGANAVIERIAAHLGRVRVEYR